MSIRMKFDQIVFLYTICKLYCSGTGNLSSLCTMLTVELYNWSKNACISGN